MTTPIARGPLVGIRILDLTTNFAAYSGRLLADLGADVIRVEPPTGDPLRQASPQFQAANAETVSAAYLFLNASKKSISLNLARPEGLALFRDLVSRSDVVLESFKPGTLASWGAGYDAMHEWNSRMILVSITPYGQSGPRSSYQATDLTLLASGGLLSLGGYVDTGPVAIPGEQGFYASAIFGTVSALSALLERETTQCGQWLDVSGQECVAFALEDAIPEWYINNSVRQRTGERAREAGTGVYPCRDGYISMVAGRLGTAKGFVALTRWIAESGVPGSNDLLAEKWQDFKYRQSEEGIDRFGAIFGEFCATRGKQQLYDEGQARQIAIAPVNTIADLFENEQLRANNFIRRKFNREYRQEFAFPGPPYRLSRSPAAIRSSAPRSGEHNRDIFIGELGLTEGKLGALKAAGII